MVREQVQSEQETHFDIVRGGFPAFSLDPIGNSMIDTLEYPVTNPKSKMRIAAGLIHFFASFSPASISAHEGARQR